MSNVEEYISWNSISEKEKAEFFLSQTHLKLRNMSNAEKFIQEHTRNSYNYNSYAQYPMPWLTPDQARKAVEIAREETTEKIKRLLEENYLIKSAEPLRWVSWEKVFTDLKQAMKDE